MYSKYADIKKLFWEIKSNTSLLCVLQLRKSRQFCGFVALLSKAMQEGMIRKVKSLKFQLYESRSWNFHVFIWRRAEESYLKRAISRSSPELIFLLTFVLSGFLPSFESLMLPIGLKINSNSGPFFLLIIKFLNSDGNHTSVHILVKKSKFLEWWPSVIVFMLWKHQYKSLLKAVCW